jgi:hypothetical protein
MIVFFCISLQIYVCFGTIIFSDDKRECCMLVNAPLCLFLERAEFNFSSILNFIALKVNLFRMWANIFTALKHVELFLTLATVLPLFLSEQTPVALDV